jgi:transposase
MAVVGPSGKRLQTAVLETNAGALVGFIRGVRGTRRLCLEEGTMSEWLHEVLSPHVEEIVVLGVPPGKKGPKSDARDAAGLANQLRLGDVELAVWKGHGAFRQLRELSRSYTKITDDVVRVKNRLKAMYRSRGITTAGRSVYAVSSRGQWLGQLPAPSRPAAEQLYAVLDAVEAVKTSSQSQLVAESHRHAVSRRLETIPGMGPVRVAQALAILVTPNRFRTKRQLWSYAGLGIVMRSSSDWVRKEERWVRGEVAAPRGLNPRCNRQLKQIFKGAATTAINQAATSPLGEQYSRLVSGETKPNLAKLTVARKIAAVFLALWKSGEVYDPARTR